MKIFFTTLIILFFVVGSVVMIHKYYAVKNYSHIPGGPYYFSSFASYIKPFRPIDEITLEEVHQRKNQQDVYYEAYFDEKGRIVTFTKYDNDKIVFREDYEYENKKLVNSIMKKFE